MIVRERRAVEELARVLDGGMPADDASARSRRLATLASRVDEHTTLVEPDAAFRAAMRRQLCEQIDALGVPGAEPTLPERAAATVHERTARARRSAKLAVASGVASSLLGTAGVAVAAEEALPGETLYPVKRTTESVRLALAGDLTTEGRLHLAFAVERLEELRLSLGQLSTEQAVDTLADMDAATVAGSDELLTAGRTLGQPGLITEVDNFTGQQATGLAALIDELPIGARGQARDSLQLLNRLRAQVLVAVPAACDCEPDGTTAGTLTGPTGAACDCERDGAGSTAEGEPNRADGTDGARPGTRTSGPASSPDGSTDTPGGSLGDAADDTTAPVDDSVDGATDLVDEATGGASTPTTGPVDGASDAVGDTVNDAQDGLDDVTETPTVEELGDDLADLFGD